MAYLAPYCSLTGVVEWRVEQLIVDMGGGGVGWLESMEKQE